jgi:glycerophosphoryl diester phosphodiesterase
MSKQMGYTYVECDVSFTADSVAVLLHDSTIDRTSDGSGNIQSLTYQQLLQYDFGSWFNSKFAGTKIPTFKEFMMYCKGLALHPYIELKISGGYTEEQIKQVVDEVELCGMKGKVTYISFDATYLRYVKDYDEEARLGYLADVKTFTINTANGLKTGKNEVFMDVDYRNATEEKVALCIENGLPMEVWTVNDANIIKKLNPYVSGVTSDNQIAGKILYDLYSTYTDTDYIPATSITLSKTNLTFEELKSQTLTATVAPSNASGSVVWKSSNTSIATVSNGVVTPLKDGSCTITASIDSVSASCSITIATVGNVYSVTENLTGCTSSNNAVNVVEGEAYTDTFTHIIGYTLEEATVSITMGGVDASNYYNDGVLNIPSVTGDIVVTIIAKEKEVVKYNITRNLTNCTSSSSAIEAIEDESHTEIFTAPLGYTLEGATVSITMGGTDVSSYYNNGTLSIPSVTGDIVINIVAKEKVLLKYSITRNLTNCTSSSDVTEVTETQAHTETFSADTGYIILRSKVSITMDGADISNYYNNGTLNIPSVTGDIVINIEGAELTSPIIDYVFSTDGTNGILTNTGTGGSTYNIQTVGEYSVTDNKLSLLNGAYASVNYATTTTGTFTIHVRGCFDNIIGNQYERMIRSNSDALCIYYVKGSKNFGVKLANMGGGNNTVHDTSKAGWSGGSNTMNVDYDVIGVETIHDFVFTADGTTIKFYLDGELLASQNQSVLKAGTSYALGNIQSNSYNANITIEKWRIFGYALSAEEVAGLISSN